MFIISVPVGLIFEDLPSKMQIAIRKYKGSFAAQKITGTSAYEDKELRLIYADLTKEQVLGFITDDLFDEDGEQYSWDTGWAILATENETVNQGLLLDYYDDILVYDEDGELLSTVAVTDLTNKIQTWAGKKWLY